MFIPIEKNSSIQINQFVDKISTSFYWIQFDFLWYIGLSLTDKVRMR